MATTKQKLVERGKTLNWKIEKEKFETIIDSKAIITQADTHIEEKMVSENSFINVIDTRNNPDNPNDKTYVYPIVENTYNTLVGKKFTIDWGDNTSTIITDGVFTQAKLTHEYETAGEYTITIESEIGKMPSYSIWKYKTVNNNNYKITKVLNSFMPVINSYGNTFQPYYNSFSLSYAPKLNYLPSNLFAKLSYITNMSEFIMYAESLEEVPEGLFDPLVNLEVGRRIFQGCKKLKAFPDNFFAKNLKWYIFDATFNGCNSLKMNSLMFGDLIDRFTHLPNNASQVDFYLSFAVYSGETDKGGTAPELWNCVYKKEDGTILTPRITRPFSNRLNLTNYSDIPSDWK